jgi:hypothetical protein
MLLYVVYGERKLYFVSYFLTRMAPYGFRTTSGRQEGTEGTDRRNGPFISLKNGSFKEPLLSVHFVWALGMRCPWAVSLLQEREEATHYETANG